MIEMKFIDLMEEAEAAETASTTTPLTAVRLGPDDTYLVPFTSMTGEIDVHVCGMDGLRGIVACNGSDCVLGKAGLKPTKRRLLPMYSPGDGCVRVVVFEKSYAAKAFFPQFRACYGAAHNAGHRVVLTVTMANDYKTYAVKSRTPRASSRSL